MKYFLEIWPWSWNIADLKTNCPKPSFVTVTGCPPGWFAGRVAWRGEEGSWIEKTWHAHAYGKFEKELYDMYVYIYRLSPFPVIVVNEGL